MKRTAWVFGTLLGMAAATAGTGARADGDTGYLTVTSSPPAHVFIDDTDTGSTTPLTHYALKAGHHRVVLVTDSGTRRPIGIVIVAGEEKRLNVNM